MYSSPAGMRHKMAIGKPPAGLQNYEIMPKPGMSRDRQLLQKSKLSRDIYSGAFQIPPPGKHPAEREAYGAERPRMERRVSVYEVERPNCALISVRAYITKGIQCVKFIRRVLFAQQNRLLNTNK